MFEKFNWNWCTLFTFSFYKKIDTLHCLRKPLVFQIKWESLQLIILVTKAVKQSCLTWRCLYAELSPQNCPRHSQAQRQHKNQILCNWDSGNCSAETFSSALLGARTGERSAEKNHWQYLLLIKKYYCLQIGKWFFCHLSDSSVSCSALNLTV